MKRFSLLFTALVLAGLVFAPLSRGFERSGIVVDTMNSGQYTYLEVETPNGKYWAAAPKIKLSVGDRVDVSPGSEMKNFFSPSLNRTFESIVFSSGVKVIGNSESGQAVPEGHSTQ